MLFHPNLVTRRSHIDFTRQQRDADRFAISMPRDILMPHVGSSIFRNVNQFREVAVDSVTDRLHVDPLRVFANHVIKSPAVVAATIHL